jgi:4'-phosphopantetheinyl transferase EntD
VFERILPAAAAVASAAGDIAGASLFPEEEAAIGRAVEKRRLEFATGRACARRALAQLGLPPAPIPSGPKGEPCWPDGVVGSITHCEGYRACAVAPARELAAIGIDAEPNLPLPQGLLADIALPPERAHLAELARERPDVHWDRLLFSIKECVYKVWFPLAERWLGFEDATVEIDPRRGTFSVRLLVPGPTYDGAALSELAGAWLAGEGLLLAAIALPAAKGGEGAAA